MEMDRKVIHSATKSQRVWKMYLKVEELAVWALGSSWGPAASIFISLPFTPCSYFALYNFTAAIYEPLLWASTAALLLFIAARRDHLSLDPPLLPFFLHLYRLCWVQSISLFPPPPHPPTIFFCAGVSIHNTHIYLSILVIGQSDKVVYQGKCPTSAGYCRQGLYVGQNAILYPSIKKTNQDSNWSWKLFVRLHVTGRQPWL